MKTPVDEARGRIVGYDENRGELLIRAPYDDWFTLTKREYKECTVRLIDRRKLSDKQRRACYALIGEIADFCGEGKDRTKEYMKLKFLVEDIQDTGDTLFSFSDAPMSLVCAFQRFLVRFILEWDIPCKFPLLDLVDDVGDYIYACLINKKCCICGKRAELHHTDHVGIGRDRNEITHEGMRAYPLCREHHTEAHTIGAATFRDKYHLTDGIALDKTLCKLYNINARKESPNA